MIKKTIWRRIFRVSFQLFFLLTLILSVAQADTVLSVRAGGIVEMENGKKIALAGIQIDEDSLTVLRILLAGKASDFSAEKEITAGAGEPISGYLYVEIEEAFIGSAGDRKGRTVMVNEFLLSMGLAQVRHDQLFSKRDQFLALEKTARERGEGVWSREISG